MGIDLIISNILLILSFGKATKLYKKLCTLCISINIAPKKTTIKTQISELQQPLSPKNPTTKPNKLNPPTNKYTHAPFNVPLFRAASAPNAPSQPNESDTSAKQ